VLLSGGNVDEALLAQVASAASRAGKRGEPEASRARSEAEPSGDRSG
jgi:hypothetical protein